MRLFFKFLNRTRRGLNKLRLHYLLEDNGIYLNYTPGAWAIGWDDVGVLYQEMKRYEQHGTISYLELGSGFSTIVVSAIANKMFNLIKIYSLEADSDWLEHTKKQINSLITLGGGGGVEFFQLSEDYKNIQSVLENISKEGTFDIIFIDAPPDTLMPDARLKVLNYIFDLLGEKSTLILHDAKRTDEYFAYNKFKERFYSSTLYDTEKGIAVMRHPRPSL